MISGWLEELGRREIRPGPWTLEPANELLARLGNPHERFRALHVAGTRGKGSTCALLSAALVGAGYRTGLTTSPHLVSPCERIRLDGEPIALDRLLELAGRVKSASDGLDPGYFEVMTIAAFLAFAEDRVDVAVVEVGLGGRLDATNVVLPWVTGITRLGLDHADRLGPTRADVAREKAGIMKAGARAVLGANEPEATLVVLERARELGVPLRCLTEDDVRRAPATALPGAVQAENAAVAEAMLEELAIASEGRVVVGPDALREGFLAVRWPARLELIAGGLSRQPRVDLLLDVAHDVDSVEALARHAASLPAPAAVLFSCLREKDLPGIARVMAASEALRGATIVVPELESPRARPAADVIDALRGLGLDARPARDVAEAVAAARAVASRPGVDSLVIAFGSFVIASELLRLLDPMPASLRR